jgi:hypothetical protein
MVPAAVDDALVGGATARDDNDATGSSRECYQDGVLERELWRKLRGDQLWRFCERGGRGASCRQGRGRKL